jgi:hypothetical protein
LRQNWDAKGGQNEAGPFIRLLTRLGNPFIPHFSQIT